MRETIVVRLDRDGKGEDEDGNIYEASPELAGAYVTFDVPQPDEVQDEESE